MREPYGLVLARHDQLPGLQPPCRLLRRQFDLPAIHATIEAAYLRGLGEDDGPVRDAIVGYRTTVVLRSAFTAIPFERLAEPVTPELTELFRRRVALARFLTDLGLALPGVPY